MSFERKLHLCLHSKECHFSTEINFERTTDEFQKNVIRSGPVSNAKNIKADSPKILRPTHFSRTKDINAKKLLVGAIP
jgi:hypothetical protein